MLVTVTGATGHLGSALVRQLLTEGHRVRVFIRKSSSTRGIDGLDVEIAYGDVTNLDSLLEAFGGASQVFHLAGIVSIMPRMQPHIHNVNVQGTINVIKACIEHSVQRLVYTSSIHAISSPPAGIAITEMHPIDPTRVVGDYAKSKAAATLEVIDATQRGLLDTVALCPTGIIGPYDYHGSYIGRTIDLYCSGKIPAYVSGEYDFIDVRDVASGITSASRMGKSGQHYILSGQQVSVEDFFYELQQKTGVSAPRIKIPKPFAQVAGYISGYGSSFVGGDSVFTSYSVKTLYSNSSVSSDLAHRELGFEPRDWKESLADHIDWMIDDGIIDRP